MRADEPKDEPPADIEPAEPEEPQTSLHEQSVAPEPADSNARD